MVMVRLPSGTGQVGMVGGVAVLGQSIPVRIRNCTGMMQEPPLTATREGVMSLQPVLGPTGLRWGTHHTEQKTMTSTLIEQANLAGSASAAAPAAAAGRALTLTPDQRAAVDGILSDIRVRGARPVLCGYAGTGKTVTTAALVSELIDDGWRVVVATPTHKARAQVERALAANGAHGFEAVTVHRLLGLKQVRDWATGKETFAPDPGGKNMLREREEWDEELHKKVPAQQIDIVIVDETSMLSSELYDLLLREIKGRPVVFVGDDRQLLPVGEDQVCRAFTEGSSIYRLTEVLRHDGAILNLATATRQLTIGRAQFACATGGGSKVIAYRRRDEWLHNLLESAASGDALENPDFCRALAFDNKSVENLNELIHERKYGSNAPEFKEGMVCVTCDAIPDPVTGGAMLHSTVDVQIESADLVDWEPPQAQGEQLLLLPERETFLVWNLEVLAFGDDSSIIRQVRVIAKADETAWKESQKRIADAAKAEKDDQKRKDLWRLYFRRKDQAGRLQPASALTIHKSQGSTFRHVFLHWSIDGWGSAPTAQQNQLTYVGITRAAESLHVIADR